ncbi:Bax inhibitor-1/YccA family protein [Aneurinibacillus sp. Ricciae_BoGa-3]|uniref:Bax inhibitor-1/YccA family protein n=1 Tax=Aneurinibacillus sp. Ricciae_BoGa-3 TaxID=3022697 RepID=UPI0023422806|nr:Bax inhibitor-1/YccA family protein [Aneurinibacillus sp. Ricciae_BoGa-3]WCK55343.1 Bax inhibitor-1/YccA family protein [Aneurinibacillus sp. Ricciae_BoGa-3]
MNIATLVRTQQRYIQRVFSWMFVGLLMTAIVAFLLGSNQKVISYFQQHPGVFFGIVIAELVLVFFLSARINKMSATAATLIFFIYAALNGVTFSLLFSVYSLGSIGVTFLVTAGMFGALAAYGAITKRDLSKMGSILFMALIGLVLASVVNMFIASSGLTWIITYAGVIIFAGLTAYDMQIIKQNGTFVRDENEEVVTRSAIMGALMLYLDFINLFFYLLRIFGNRD